MTHFRKVLKSDLFRQITFLNTFLSAEDVLSVAAVEGCLWL